ncbi:MAG TPA: AsnC family transcriptional regulator [Actinocrinis sp.]|nr:AsnC family transcriptional regulator [Actinocrinis sp.]
MADLLDVQLLHALQIDGRAALILIAEVLGVSDQTVARRYQRLRAAGLLRVRGLLELYAAVSCRTADSFYGYLTDRVAGLDAVQHLETMPIVQTVKTSSVLTAAEPLG